MKVNSWLISFGLFFMLGGLLSLSMTISNMPIYGMLTTINENIGGKGLDGDLGDLIVWLVLIGLSSSVVGIIMLALSIKKAS